MDNKKGALALAECRPDYAIDCSLMLHNQRSKKDFIIRTTLDSLGVWKSKHNVSLSPYSDKVNAVTKDVAIIKDELWVFGIDASKSNDVFTAVKIGMKYHQANAKDIIGDVYVKNLNTELENDMGTQALITANKQLYKSVCSSVIEAAKLLGVQGIINFWVISSNLNHKIPKAALHNALHEGGASKIETDDTTIPIFSGPNSGGPGFRFKQNLHLATLKL